MKIKSKFCWYHIVRCWLLSVTVVNRHRTLEDNVLLTTIRCNRTTYTYKYFPMDTTKQRLTSFCIFQWAVLTFYWLINSHHFWIWPRYLLFVFVTFDLFVFVLLFLISSRYEYFYTIFFSIYMCVHIILLVTDSSLCRSICWLINLFLQYSSATWI